MPDTEPTQPKLGEAVSESLKKIRATVGPTPKWATYLKLLMLAVVALWAGVPHLDVTLLFIAGVAFIEWREFREKP
jgi:hypothetical protein